MTNNKEYRKPNIRYEWQTEFDRQKAEASMKIAELFDEYSPEAVMAAMLDVIHDNMSNEFREEHGREYGDDYLPPNPRQGIVTDESTSDEGSADNFESRE